MKPRFEQFISERRYLLNVSETTTRWYAEALAELPTETPNADAVKQTIIRMRARGLRATTINSRLIAINAYLHWNATGGNEKCGAGCHHIKARKLKEDDREPETYSADHVKRLLSWKPSTFPEHRLQTMIAVLLDTGCRRDECLGLHTSDIDFDNLLLTVHGKGRKDRKIPMSLELRRRLFNYQKRVDKLKGATRPTGTLIFGTRTGTKIAGRNFLRNVRNLCRRLGFNAPARCLHAFRHSYATNYLRRGGSVVLLQKQLGHADITTTMVYTHLVVSDLQEKHEGLTLLQP